MNKNRLHSSILLLLRHYYEQVKKYKTYAALGMLLPGIGTALTIYGSPLVVARIITLIESGTLTTLEQLLPYVLLFGGLWLVGEIFWRIALHYLIKLEIASIKNLYANAFEYLLAKDQDFFSNNFAGSLTKKSIAYAKNFEGVIDTLSFSVFSNLIPLVFISVVLWQFSPYLVLALIGLISVTLLIIRPLIAKRQKLVHKREIASNKLSGHISDVITNISAVQAFGNETAEYGTLKKYAQDYADKAAESWNYHNQRIDLITAPMYVLTNVVGLMLAISIGRGSGTSTEIIFVSFSYFANFSRVLWEFNRIYRNLESNITDAAQFTELLLDKPQIIDVEQPIKPKIYRGDIQFKDVSFHYDGQSDSELFSKLNLHIKPGEKIGLVGHSGSGKSTLTKLLLRFIDPTNGYILVDTQNIRELSQSGFRKRVAYVPQEPLLFHRSISENIAYSNPRASQQEIEAVAKMAHAHEFICQLPEGYQTMVGERGIKLSGGQRQRIAIARAMLKNTPILLLDEATSALDSESEVLIQDALWKLMEQKTAIVIAHRLSTIQKMDRIIVMHHGEIIEEGSHSELIRNNGIYADLWKHQTGGFLSE